MGIWWENEVCIGSTWKEYLAGDEIFGGNGPEYGDTGACLYLDTIATIYPEFEQVEGVDKTDGCLSRVFRGFLVVELFALHVRPPAVHHHSH